MKRGTGETTRQLQRAPVGSYFVWCNHHLDYPVKLAQSLGRKDIHIVSPSWLERGWRGCRFTDIIIDHAIQTMPLTDQQWDGYMAALSHARLMKQPS